MAKLTSYGYMHVNGLVDRLQIHQSKPLCWKKFSVSNTAKIINIYIEKEKKVVDQRIAKKQAIHYVLIACSDSWFQVPFSPKLFVLQQLGEVEWELLEAGPGGGLGLNDLLPALLDIFAVWTQTKSISFQLFSISLSPFLFNSLSLSLSQFICLGELCSYCYFAKDSQLVGRSDLITLRKGYTV